MKEQVVLAAIVLLQRFHPLLSQGKSETHFATTALAFVFKQLEDFGEAEVAHIKITNPKFKQFIAFAVLSESEIQQRTEIDDSRMHTIKNEKFSGENVQCDGIACKTRHGEIQAIYKKLFDQEREKLKRNNGNGIPYIVLFSHYIPCFGTREVRYSCAVELSNYVYAGSGSFKMIVLFREEYKGTDSKMSIRYMSAEGITVYQGVENNKYLDVSARFSLGSITQERGNAIFQRTYFDCIKDPDEDYKCYERCIGKEDVVDKLIAQYVNFATYECTRGKSISARLSFLTKKSLFECISEYIEEYTGPGCHTCVRKRRDFKFYLRICAAFAKEYSTHIGYNEDPTNVFSQTWSIRQMFWKDAYHPKFQEFPRAQKAIFCALKTMDVKSLCTKIRSSKHHPEELKIQIRDLSTEFKNAAKLSSPM